MALNMIMISLFFISAHLYLFVFLFGHAGGREVKIGEFHSTNEVLDLGIGARIAWKGKHKVKWIYFYYIKTGNLYQILKPFLLTIIVKFFRKKWIWFNIVCISIEVICVFQMHNLIQIVVLFLILLKNFSHSFYTTQAALHPQLIEP